MGAMGRCAFTLTELLVVIAIVGMLMALLMPAASTAWSAARMTVCQRNLNQIFQAFGVHAAGAQEPGSESATAYYPAADEWPSIPLDACTNPAIFICPETDDVLEYGTGSGSISLGGFVYVHRVRGFSVRFNSSTHQGLGHMNLGTRHGRDERGEYIEVGLDDNSTVTEAYMNGDGHDGLIRIYGGEGTAPVAKLMTYSCGELNCVLYNGEPLFVSATDPPEVSDPSSSAYGWLGPGASKNGMVVPLGPEAGWTCSYGMTKGSEQFHTGMHKPLVMDYEHIVVRADEPGLMDNLQEGVRHLGLLNVLFTDGSVQPCSPTELDPGLPGNETLWQP